MRRVVPLVVFVAACSSLPEPPPDEPGVPVAETRRDWYPGREQEQRRARVLVHTDGRVERHGPEFVFWPNGNVRIERSFENGRQVGAMRSFFEDGAPRSHVDFGDGVELAMMTFFRQDGTLSAEGAGIAGIKEGPWIYWHENGVRAKTGPYTRGIREGVWTIFDDEGARRAEGRYEGGLRVGTWTLWDEAGSAFVKEGQPPKNAP